THEALLDASTFIRTIEERQGLMVACIEEIAFRMGYITGDAVLRIARPMKDNSYGQYLLRLVESEPEDRSLNGLHGRGQARLPDPVLPPGSSHRRRRARRA